LKVAFVHSRFPSLSETFLLRELLAHERLGLEFVVLALRPSREKVVHGDARGLLPRLRTLPFLFSPRVLGPALRTFLRRPARTLACLAGVVGLHWRAPDILLKSLAVVPKTLAWATLLPREGVGHVHAQWATYPATSAWMIHRLTGLPYSVSVHATDIRFRPVGQERKFLEAAFVATCADLNVAYLRSRYPRVPSERWRRIYHGIDRGAFPFRREGREATLILAVGRYDPTKGFHHLVEACRLLAEGGSSFDCRIVGWGPLGRDLRRRIERAGMGDRVRLVGPLTQEEVRALYARAAVLVQPSVPDPRGRGDVLPNVILEAMASGAPVVASAEAAIPEAIDDGRSGLLVPPGDPGALAGALRRVLEEPALQESLAREALRVVSERFDPERNARVFLSHLEALHGVRPGAGRAGPGEDGVRRTGAGPGREA
jgi:colanic acid/amylovoran biosynthesis glycosyltransferase